MYPKEFQESTEIVKDSYSKYQRRKRSAELYRDKMLSNANVVPYNPTLCLKYQCHINVECATAIHIVKYIFKYIYKGFDCAMLETSEVVDSELRYHEPNHFTASRYCSAIEAVWRLLEHKMHGLSHSVERLCVYMLNEQMVQFTEGNEEFILA